jgi:hypothetical protein
VKTSAREFGIQFAWLGCFCIALALDIVGQCVQWVADGLDWVAEIFRGAVDELEEMP